MYSDFIGEKLEKVTSILNENNVKYKVNSIKGFKDQEILNDEIVIKVKYDDILTLTTSKFKLNI